MKTTQKCVSCKEWVITTEHNESSLRGEKRRWGCLWRSKLLNHTLSHCLLPKFQTETLLIYWQLSPCCLFLVLSLPVDVDQTVTFILLCPGFSLQAASMTVTQWRPPGRLGKCANPPFPLQWEKKLASLLSGYVNWFEQNSFC